MSEQPNIVSWQEMQRTTVFDNPYRSIEEIIFKLPNGQVEEFYIKAEGKAVSVLAFDLDGLVVLSKQFRPGPGLILDELPGGFADDGENHLLAAERELLEETGYRGNLEFIGTCLDDAYSNLVRYCYIAKECRVVGAPVNQEAEQTQVVLKTQKEFRDQLRTGQLSDLEVGYLGLDYLGLL